MKKSRDCRGILVPGVSILESCVTMRDKKEKLDSVLSKTGLYINPRARLNNKRDKWILSAR